jgi:hypothetical protein
VETPTQFVCAGRRQAEEAAAEERRLAREAGHGKLAARRSGPKPCGFVLPRTVCKREITRKEALAYLQSGRTELLEDFTSRFGRPFSATLFLKENGRHGFEFPPRGAAKGAAGEGAPTPSEAKPPRRRARREPAAKGAEAKPAKPARAAARAPRARARRKRPASGDTGS